MSSAQIRRSFSDIFGIFGSAMAVAGAARGGRQPARHDLERLGIDPDQYRSIGRR